MACEHPIAAARRKLGISQGELGRLLGVRFNSVSRWELGKLIPGRSREAKLREVLKLDDLQIWQVYHFRPKRRLATAAKAKARRNPIW